jgi:hypothetical protein
MITKEFIELINNKPIIPNDIYNLNGVEVLCKFTQKRQILYNIYQVRNDMFNDADYRMKSNNANFYNGLNEVVLNLNNSKSENILFIEVKTKDNDEISLFFEDNSNLFLGYIYIR